MSDNINEYGVLVLSDRDRLECSYLVQCRGEKAIRWAVSQLPGQRKPYVSNVAKILKVDIPKDLPDPLKVISVDQGLAMIQAITGLKARKFKV